MTDKDMMETLSLPCGCNCMHSARSSYLQRSSVTGPIWRNPRKEGCTKLTMSVLQFYKAVYLHRLGVLSPTQLHWAFSALTLLVGWQERRPACKNWVMRYWHSYLSGVRCRWFAYHPAGATATPASLGPVKSRMVYLSGAGSPRLSWKKAVKWM